MAAGHDLLLAAAGTGVELVEVGKSAKWDLSSAEYMTYTQGTPTNARKFTMSVWYYKCQHATHQALFYGYDGSTDRSGILVANDNKFYFQGEVGGATPLQLKSAQVLRDNAWYHLLAIWDGDNAVTANRAQLWINGVKETNFTTAVYPSQGTDIEMIQDGYSAWISRHPVSTSYLDGYTAEQVLIDGQSLAPTSFGEFDSTGLYWTPKSSAAIKALTFGDNGFYLDNVTNAHTDASGNANHFTNVNTVVTSTHTPTNSKCLINPLAIHVASTTNAGISASSTATDRGLGFGTIPFNSEDETGFYFEWVPKTSAGSSIGGFALGMCDVSLTGLAATRPGDDNALSWSFAGNGGKSHTGYVANGTWDSQSNGTGALGNTYQIAVKAGSVYYGINDTWYDSSDDSFANAGAAHEDVTGFMVPLISHGHASVCTYDLNTVAEDYNYTKPTGLQDITTTNIAASTTRTVSDVYKHWANCIYEGTGSAQDITIANETPNGSSFDPEFVWTKNRDAADEHKLVDIVRGATKELSTDSVNAESTDSNGVTSITSTGKYVLGSGAAGYNDSGESFVAWCAKLGGAASTTSPAGTIASSSSVNTTLGMSVATFTGTGSAGTVGHGLGVAPKLIIIKKRNDDRAWPLAHTDVTTDAGGVYFQMDVPEGGLTNNSTLYNTITSTTVELGATDQLNGSGDTYVMICFAPSEFISLGSYEGNASTDGTFVPTINSAGVPLMPIYHLAKNIDFADSWNIMDAARSSYNLTDAMLSPNAAAAEVTGADRKVDFVSGGIKERGADTALNAAYTYIHLTIGIPIIDTDGRILGAR